MYFEHRNIYAILKVRPKSWMRKTSIIFTCGQKIGCANAHPCILGSSAPGLHSSIHFSGMFLLISDNLSPSVSKKVFRSLVAPMGITIDEFESLTPSGKLHYLSELILFY